MEIHKKTLFEVIGKMKKSELIDLLNVVYDNLEGKSRRDAFGGLYNEIVKESLSPEELLEEIETFYERSMKGRYYAPFMINSKNFMDVPEETDEWFDEISMYLDSVSDLVKAKNYELGVKCFKILFELIDKMEDGGEIVFAKELGDWMIHAKSDYTENYIIALADTVSVEEYVDALIPIIKNDSYFSFSQQVYKKVKNHSSTEQLRAINAEIKRQSIRTNPRR